MPPQVCLGRSPGRVHNNRPPSIANRSSRLCLPAGRVECGELRRSKVWIWRPSGPSESSVSQGLARFSGLMSDVGSEPLPDKCFELATVDFSSPGISPSPL